MFVTWPEDRQGLLLINVPWCNNRSSAKQKGRPRREPWRIMWSTLWALKMERATSQSMGQSAAWESQGSSISQELPEGPGLCQDLDFSSGRPILDLAFESNTAINACCLKPLRCVLIFCSTKGKLMMHPVWKKCSCTYTQTLLSQLKWNHSLAIRIFPY